MIISVNGQQREVPAGTTIAQLLEQIDVTTRHLAVEVNQQLVPRAQHVVHVLRENDRLEIVTLVGGGA